MTALRLPLKRGDVVYHKFTYWYLLEDHTDNNTRCLAWVAENNETREKFHVVDVYWSKDIRAYNKDFQLLKKNDD